MPQPPAKRFSGIFVCYRREDSSGHAGRLFDKLVEHFGRDRIFMDIDTIEPGEDFVTVIENAVGSCEILIAVIGRQWFSATGEPPGYMHDENDWVRVEIATALSRDIRVIPVLVNRGSMPKSQDLPDDVAKFTRRNYIELSDLRWQNDVERLIGVMEKVLVQMPPPTPRPRSKKRSRPKTVSKPPTKPRAPLQISERQVSGVTILDLNGKITIGESSVALRVMVRRLLDTGKKKILLNLAKVDNIDSGGMGELLSSNIAISNEGGQLTLLNVTQNLTDLLAITKLLTAFDVFEDEEEALASFT